MRTRTITLILAAMALPVAGCGGDDGGDGGELSKSEYVAAADKICQNANKELEALGEPTDVNDPKKLADFLGKGIAISKDQLADLRGLKAPDEVKADMDKALDLLDEQLGLVEQLQDAVADKDQKKVQDLISQSDKLNTDANEIAKKVGLKQCGQA